MGFSEIFKDKNEYNEKSIIGFMSFAVMTITSIVDMVTGAFGNELVIQEFIYNSFVLIKFYAFSKKFACSAGIFSSNCIVRKERDQMFLYSHRANSRSSTTMRNTESFMKIEMAYICTNFSKGYKTD